MHSFRSITVYLGMTFKFPVFSLAAFAASVDLDQIRQNVKSDLGATLTFQTRAT